ncbi:MAG: cob(I)yrinic acid a,c-diamide adenosyltransferase [Angelakisella sp.]
MIQIYCGDGKGKTTAAFGLAARASQGGYKVVIAQFLKGRSSGEVSAVSSLPNVTLLTANLPDVFSWQMTPEQKTEVLEKHNDLLARAASHCGDHKTMLVLDELVGALAAQLVDREAVLRLLREQGQRGNVEIVLTGRNPSEELLELADYVTEMKKVKHPFDKGVKLRKGIEY